MQSIYLFNIPCSAIHCHVWDPISICLKSLAVTNAHCSHSCLVLHFLPLSQNETLLHMSSYQRLKCHSSGRKFNKLSKRTKKKKNMIYLFIQQMLFLKNQKQLANWWLIFKLPYKGDLRVTINSTLQRLPKDIPRLFSDKIDKKNSLEYVLINLNT